MRAVVALDIFKTVYDKFRDEGLFDMEICRFINTAQLDVVRETLYNDNSKRSAGGNPVTGFENTQWSADDLGPLVFTIDGDSSDPLYSDSLGRVDYAIIQERLPINVEYISNNIADLTKPDILHISSLRRWDNGEFKKVEWVRHNEHSQRESNPFTRSMDECPTYRIVNKGIKINPSGRRLLDISVIRAPKNMWAGEVSQIHDPELPDHMMVSIIYRALILAGINIRESQFTQLLELQERK